LFFYSNIIRGGLPTFCHRWFSYTTIACKSIKLVLGIILPYLRYRYFFSPIHQNSTWKSIRRRCNEAKSHRCKIIQREPGYTAITWPRNYTSFFQVHPSHNTSFVKVIAPHLPWKHFLIASSPTLRNYRHTE